MTSQQLVQVKREAAQFSRLLDEGEVGLVSWTVMAYKQFEKVAAAFYGITVAEYREIIAAGQK